MAFSGAIEARRLQLLERGFCSATKGLVRMTSMLDFSNKSSLVSFSVFVLLQQTLDNGYCEHEPAA